jgi:BASS family bile acid:Na+ symporter
VSGFADFYLSHEYGFASSQLILAMLGMGATLERSDFVEVVSRPSAVVAGLGLQLVAAPAFAAALIHGLGLGPGVAVGMALVAAVPGGSMSNVLTYFARGNVALSITLTGLTTVACLATTPLVLGWIASEHLPIGMEMPAARIAFEIGFCLLAPLAAGMVFGTARPQARGPFSRTCIRASLGVIGLMVIGSASAGRIDPAAYGAAPLVAMLLFALGLQGVAFGMGAGLGLPSRDRLALAIEVTVRNMNLGLLIKASLLPARPGVIDPIGDAVFFIALLYGGVALPVAMLPVALGMRTRNEAG